MSTEHHSFIPTHYCYYEATYSLCMSIVNAEVKKSTICVLIKMVCENETYVLYENNTTNRRKSSRLLLIVVVHTYRQTWQRLRAPNFSSGKLRFHFERKTNYTSSQVSDKIKYMSARIFQIKTRYYNEITKWQTKT